LLFTQSLKKFSAVSYEMISRRASTLHVLKHVSVLTSCALLGSLISLDVFAEPATKQATETDNTEFSLCPVDPSVGIKHISPRVFSTEEIENTEISADSTQSSSDGSTTLEGNVIIEKHLLRVSTDRAHYDKKNNTLTVSGNVHINTQTLSLDADTGTINMDETQGQGSKQGTFTDVRFIIPESNMKGQAETIVTNDRTDDPADDEDSGGTRSTLINASITSCSLHNPDWLISADEITLDHDDEYGTADDVVIRFKSVPFMYTPYMEFPTSNKRRSGLLFPDFGTSSSRGIELAVPWYWNIAPNQDALFEPRYMERRGLEYGGKYRYLTESTSGELKGAYLPDDDVTKGDRYQMRYQQNSRIMSNLLLDVDLQDVSDADYFNDFANDLGTTSQTHLDRSARLNYNLTNWQLKALVQDIKTIDDTTLISERPYTRLPQLTFNGDTEIASSSVFFTLDSEYVDFAHEDDVKITGSRATVRPGLRLPVSGPAWYIDPAVKFSHTHYDVGIDGNATVPGSSLPVEDRNLPISSIDAGLFFERQLDSGYQQTIEPRLYYLYVPFEDQDNIPIFDTSTPTFTIAQLFRDNRFVGGDRIGDANQLTLALTSRVLNTSKGNEFLRASIGQIIYFEDRQVSLDGTNDVASQSDIIAELDVDWGRWLSNIDLQWDTNSSELSQENYFLHYKSDHRHLFNIGYRKRLFNGKTDIEQTDTSFVFALSRKYNSVVRWNYSLKDRKNIDVIAGLTYDSCCWSIQLLAQRRLKNTTVSTIVNDDPYDNSILVQFVFKGLGSLSGSRARKTLERSIYGYTDTFQ